MLISATEREVLFDLDERLCREGQAAEDRGDVQAADELCVLKCLVEMALLSNSRSQFLAAISRPILRAIVDAQAEGRS